MRMQTVLGPNVGTGTSSGHRSALMTARWWHTQQHTSGDRTPLARMLPRVMGSIGSLMRRAAMRRLYAGPWPSGKRMGGKADRQRAADVPVYRPVTLRNPATSANRCDGCHQAIRQLPPCSLSP
jgi:hypothetical protein